MTEQKRQTEPRLGRRRLLGSVGGLLGVSVLPDSSFGETVSQSTTEKRARVTDGGVYDGPYANHTESHHPGPPRFLQVGESLTNPAHVGEYGAFGFRDNLAPWLPAPTADAESYDGSSFEWSLAESPAESDTDLAFASTASEDQPRFTPGKQNTADFEPDVPGRYVLELEAPDGVHELTVHVFPDGRGSPPSLELDATRSEDESTFTVDAQTQLAPGSDASPRDIEVVFVADDRDSLDMDTIETDGQQARVPVDALDGEPARVHAVAYDGISRSMMDTVELQPDGSVSLPNRPPEWVTDGVLYQIFPRSWAGQRGDTTMDDLTAGVEYLDDLGIDMVWLTPVVPAESVTRQNDGALLAPEYDYLADTLSGGGPHGYDTLDYFGISPDLVPEGKEPVEAYREFVEECHENDIKVIFDVVVSHLGRSHPFFQDTIADQNESPPTEPLEYPKVTEWRRDSDHFEWFDRIETDDIFEGEVIEPAPHATGFFGLRHMPNLNYNTLAVREHILAIADFWSGDVGVDGFRCDIAWGVPRSLWQEVRELVRDNDSEFLLLDETVPKDPRMGENAFDMHFDTEGFTVLSQDVARGEASPGQLVDAVRKRQNEGIPPHKRVLNIVENHDEHRLLNQAVLDLSNPNRDEITETEWEAGAHLQRVCWATGVLLPGVPGIYYGQERQISRFGTGRHLGDDDPRGRTNGGADISSDVRPGGRQRAFMNWDEVPEAHLSFYRELVESYHDLDVLKPDAALRSAWSYTTDQVLVFGRDGSHLDDVDGPERVVVVVNFETDTAEVAVRPAVDTVDLLSGERLEDQNEVRPDTVLEVDDVLVLETPDLYSTGELVADFDPPSGTDSGPGDYEYPTSEDIAPESFDISAFTVNQTPETVQFRVGIEGDLTNPRGFQHGLSHQHLQVYVRDPDAEGGSRQARTGVDATFEQPYQYSVVCDGDNGVRVETADGTEVTEGTLRVNTVTDEFLVAVPRDAFGANIQALELAPLMLGYDETAPGNVRQVESTASQTSFGGGTHDTAPNVIDTGLPATFPNEEVLAYDEDEPATIPYAAVITAFEQISQTDLPTGEGYGPGTYEVPTGQDYYEEAWDIDEITIHESRDAVRVEYTMATEPENPWGFDPGFSHQFLQIYLHVPGGSPSAVLGRKGTNVAFRAPYHYRVVVHGEGVQVVENAAGETVSRNVEVSLDGRTIAVEFPTAAVEWDTDQQGVGIAPTVMAYDGFGDGSLRFIGPDPGEHRIGGGSVDSIDPAVMDMLVPTEMDRQSVLADYGPTDPPRLPFVGLGPLEDIVEVQAELPETDEEQSESDDEQSESDENQSGTDDETESEADDSENDSETDEATPDDGSSDTPDAQSETSPADTEEADGGGPGFGIGGAVSGLGGVAYLLNRRLDSATEDESE